MQREEEGLGNREYLLQVCPDAQGWATPQPPVDLGDAKRQSQDIGLCDPGACTAAEEALKKEAVKTMNLKMRNKPIRNESI